MRLFGAFAGLGRGRQRVARVVVWAVRPYHVVRSGAAVPIVRVRRETVGRVQRYL